MPTNEFLPFATAGGANVMTQAEYAAEAARLAGVIAGIGKSALANKSWRQSAVMAAMLGQFIADYGNLDALDNGNVANLVRDFARTLQASTFSYAVATGTANAWTVAPTPAVATYAAGRVLNIIAPATNTSTTVNANISGLGNRRIKKADGTDPAIGDLVSGVPYSTIDDGTNIRVLSALPSDIKAAASGMVIPGNIIAFPLSGIYTPSANMVACKVTMVGGGGAGGVGDTGGYLGGGGGSAAMIIAYFLRSQLGATEAVTIGGGGYGYPPSGMYGGEPGGNTTFKNMIAGGGGGGGTAPGAHGASGVAGTFTIAGPGVAAGIRGADGPTGARWDTPSALGVYGRGGSGGSISYGLGGSAGFGGYAFIEEYLQS